MIQTISCRRTPSPLTLDVGTMMKRLISLLLLTSIAMPVLADQRFKSIDEYYKAIGTPQHRPHTADRPNANGRLVVGILQVWPTPEEPKAMVFVVQEGPSGEVSENARSKPFDFGDGGARSHVEFVDAKSNTGFSIQINYSGACTSGFDIFRFSKRDDSWIVSGRDSTRYHCSENDKSFGDTRNEISANFLTGKVESKYYSQNRLRKSIVERKKFTKFTITEFDPFQDTYGPR